LDLNQKKTAMHLSKTALSRITLWVLVAGCGAAFQSQAQSYLSPNPPQHAYEDRFRLEVDMLYGAYNTQVRLDKVTTNAGSITAVTPGTTVSGETDLGLAKSQVLGQVELTLLPGKHHMVRFNALSMRRDANHVLTRNISWGNELTPYVIGDRVDSHLNLSLIGLTYGYLPLRTDRYELGVSFGVQIASVSANAEVRATHPPRSAEAAAGPIPVFGLEGRYDFTRRWSVDARWQYLSLGWAKSFGADLSGVQATISDGRLALRWRQNQHLLYGLGYRYFNLNASASSTDPSGMVTLGLTGPVLFLQASL